MSSREPTFPDGRETGKKRGREKAADILQALRVKNVSGRKQQKLITTHKARDETERSWSAVAEAFCRWLDPNNNGSRRAEELNFNKARLQRQAACSWLAADRVEMPPLRTDCICHRC